MTNQGSTAPSASGERLRFELPPARPSIGLSVIAVILGVLVSATVLIVKLAVPVALTEPVGRLVGGGDLPIVLGGILMLMIIPTALSLFLAHVVLGPEGEVPRGGRALAGAALGLGYLNVGLWLVRIILAVTWPQASGGEYYALIYNVLFWA